MNFLTNFFQKFSVDDASENERKTTSSLFDDMKERISNPFISSYLIAWLFANWKIWVGLLFYDRNSINDLQSNTFVDYILSVSSWQTMLIYPLISAIGYCFLFPFLRNGIRQTQAWFLKWGNRRLNKIAKGSSISVEHFVDLKNNYNRVTDSVQKMFANDFKQIETFKADSIKYNATIEQMQLKELTIQKELDAQKEISFDRQQQISGLHQSVKELVSVDTIKTAELISWEMYHNVSTLNGIWKIKITTDQGTTEEKYSIRGGQMTPLNNLGVDSPFRVRSIYGNPSSKSLVVDVQTNTKGVNHTIETVFHMLFVYSVKEWVELSGYAFNRNFVTWTRESDTPR